MQTAKTRNGSSDVPQRTSPTTLRTARQHKTPGSDSQTNSSPNLSKRTAKNRSPRHIEHASPRSSMSEKKRTSKVSELESQLAQLQEELKRAKEELSSSEVLKKQAHQEAEETRKQLLSLLAKLDDSQQQVAELYDTEQARLEELRKISQELDQAWQSEREVLQKQHAMDSAALASAMNEIQKLKNQLEMVAESKDTQNRHAELADAEIQSLRAEHSQALELFERMKNQLSDSKQSEVRALEVASETQMQLEVTKANAEAIRSDCLKIMDTFNNLTLELRQSNDQVITVEKLMHQLRANLDTMDAENSAYPSDEENTSKQNGQMKRQTAKLKEEIDSLGVELNQLKSALEAYEVRYQEEYIQSTLQIRNAYDAVEHARSEASVREVELEEELKNAKDAINDLKLELVSKQNLWWNISRENELISKKIQENQTNVKDLELRTELKKLEEYLKDLKSAMLDKESRIQTLAEEKEMLRTKVEVREMERSKVNEAAKATEREALMKLGYVTEEVDKSSRRATRIAEQLDAAQTLNTELEAELRRLKVQAGQWRKAAEAAAAMLSTGSNGNLVDRTASLDSSYHSIGKKMSSTFQDDIGDDSPRKKSANLIKKIGVMWKKGHK